MKTVKAKLNLSEKSVSQLLLFANAVLAAMTGNANFPAPIPTLAVLSAAINALQTSAVAAAGGGKEQTALMHQKEAILKTYLTQLGTYVEGVANNPNIPDENIETIVLSAEMQIKTQAHPQKHHFSVKQSELSGSVYLTAEGLAGIGTHDWQYCLAPLATNVWQSVDSTTKASTTISSLQPLNVYFFRHRTVTVEGVSDWEEPISLSVI